VQAEVYRKNFPKNGRGGALNQVKQSDDAEFLFGFSRMLLRTQEPPNADIHQVFLNSDFIEQSISSVSYNNRS